MNSSAISERLISAVGNATSSVLIKVQPVEPEAPTWKALLGGLLGRVLGLFLMALFLMLAVGTVHELYPDVPAVSYWQAFTLVLGLVVLTAPFRGTVWKWARR